MAVSVVVLPSVFAPEAVSARVASPSAARAATTPSVTMAVGVQGLGMVSPGATVVLDVTITNGSSDAIPAANAVVLFSNDAFSSRAALSEWSAGAGSDLAADTVVANAPTAAIAPGHALTVSVSVAPGSLPVSGAWGARRLLVQLSSGGVSLSDARSSFVWLPGGATTATPLAIIVPITVPHAIDGIISASLLASYTAPGGILSRQLDEVLNRTVTLAIDPMIVASIKILGDTAPDSARVWLQTLQGASNDSFSLSYADSDLAAGIQAGSPHILAPLNFPVVAKNFPGAITASPSPSSSVPTAAPTQNATQAPLPTPTPSASQAPLLPTAQSLMSLPYTLSGFAWPASGTVNAPTLAALSAAGYTTSIVTSANVSYQSSSDIHNSATTLDGHQGLVSDSTIADLVNAAAVQTTDLGWEQAMSNLSATLAVASAEQSSDIRSLLVGLARDTPGQAGRLAQTLSALYSLPWVSSSSLKALALSNSNSTLVSLNESASRTAKVAAMLASEAAVSTFSSVLSDPTVVTGERRLSLLATLSNSWVSTSSTWVLAAEKYDKKSQDILSSVRIAASSSLFITSKNSHVDVTVQNLLEYPVTVIVTVRSPSGSLTILNSRLQLTIEANSQAKAAVPVTSLANGDVTLFVSLTSLTAVPIAQPAQIHVDVQAGWETAFTAVVTVILVILFGLGIVRTIRRRRRRNDTMPNDTVPMDADPPAPESLLP